MSQSRYHRLRKDRHTEECFVYTPGIETETVVGMGFEGETGMVAGKFAGTVVDTPGMVYIGFA